MDEKDKIIAEKDKIIAAQAEEIRILKEMVIALTAKVAELEARLNKNSKNSNKPPSSDGLKKGATKNSRIPSGKKPGGQLGHEGKTRELSPEPDTIVELKPQTNCECGGEIIVQTDNFTVRQVTDIQPVKVVTIEYHTHDGACSCCGKIHKASFPENVNSTMSYGENVRGLVTYLNAYQLIPLQRATELVSDLFGIKLSEGTIVSAGQEAHQRLEPTESRVKGELINSDVVNYDETGMRVDGKTWWLHSAGNALYTAYHIDPKRGSEAMDRMGILPHFLGTAVHDHLKSYYKYLCSHAECNQHHLRQLAYLYEDLDMAWAAEMAWLLLRILRHVDLSKTFGASQLEQADIDEYIRKYREILLTANALENPPVESKRMSNRLSKYEDETLLFMLDFDVPFTNNLAERDVRMPKCKQKISGCFRSKDGAKAFARIRGFVSTAKKMGKNVFDGMVSIFKGESEKFLFSADV